MKKNDLTSSAIKTILLITATILCAAVAHLHHIGSISIDWVGDVFAVVTSVLIIVTDAYFLIKNNQIIDKRSGIVYLGIASIGVISFQVICDLLNLNPPANWHRLLYDAMFNVSFCMLFIITFNFADVFTLRLTRKMSE